MERVANASNKEPHKNLLLEVARFFGKHGWGYFNLDISLGKVEISVTVQE